MLIRAIDDAHISIHVLEDVYPVVQANLEDLVELLSYDDAGLLFFVGLGKLLEALGEVNAGAALEVGKYLEHAGHVESSIFSRLSVSAVAHEPLE